MSDVTVSGKLSRDALVQYVENGKLRLAGAGVAGAGLVASASAAVDLNGTLGPILDSLIELIPSIINLIIAIVPAILVVAVVGFVVTFFDRILGMIKL